MLVEQSGAGNEVVSNVVSVPDENDAFFFRLPVKMSKDTEGLDEEQEYATL